MYKQNCCCVGHECSWGVDIKPHLFLTLELDGSE